MRLVPRARLSEADDAVFLSAAYGLVPDDWQEDVLDGWLGLRPNGHWASPRCGLAVPRQNGKNAVLEIRELYGMVQLGEKFLHTAHEVKTARKAFTRLLHFFDNERKFPELHDLVLSIRRTNGQEAIFLENGASVEFVARSKGSGRGFTVDVLVLDEAQDLSFDTHAALRPTISAAPLGNPQEIMTGTPPSPTMNGEVWTRMRKAGNEGKDPRLCWHEWSVVASKDGHVDYDDRANWAKANPALGRRLSYDATMDERAAMDDTTFGRERLGIWDDGPEGDQSDLDLSGWPGLEDTESTLASVAAFAVEVSIDRAWSSVAAAGPSSGDRLHLEIVEHLPGTAWIVARCVELNTAHGPAVFVVDSVGPAASLIPDLEAAGLSVYATTTDDVATATADLIDGIAQRLFVHGPQVEVDAAIAVARKRSMGDGRFTFGRAKSGGDVSPLVAITLAAWRASEQTAYAHVMFPDDPEPPADGVQRGPGGARILSQAETTTVRYGPPT
ncbi:MAG TPA: hypothetical protein VGL75_07370 [Acidothermaceae bacterium]